MNRSISASGKLWPALFLAQACVIGSPLVDDRVRSENIGPIECNPIPPCVPLLELNLAAPDLPGVGCGLCDEPCAMSPASVDTLEDPLQCASQSLTLADPHETERTIRDVSWSRSDLEISSVLPFRLTLSHASLHEVKLQLHGPIELVITHTDDVRDLEVSAAHEESRAATVFFEQVKAERVLFHGDALTLRSRASTFTSLRANASEIDLESTALEQSKLVAATLTLTDVTLGASIIRADASTLSAVKIGSSDLRFCGDTTIVKSDVMNATVTACPQTLLRIYSSGVVASDLEGQLELDASALSGVRFGVSAMTQAVGFNSSMDANALCKLTRHIAFDPGSSIRCSGCPDVPTDVPLLCTTQEEPPRLEANRCGMLMRDPRPPLCDEPRPMHVRPTP